MKRYFLFLLLYFLNTQNLYSMESRFFDIYSRGSFPSQSITRFKPTDRCAIECLTCQQEVAIFSTMELAQRDAFIKSHTEFHNINSLRFSIYTAIDFKCDACGKTEELRKYSFGPFDQNTINANWIRFIQSHALHSRVDECTGFYSSGSSSSGQEMLNSLEN